MLSKTDLLQIAARSTDIYERLSGKVVFDGNGHSEAMNEWCAYATENNSKLFSELLSFWKYKQDSARYLFGNPELTTLNSIPDQMSQLEMIDRLLRENVDSLTESEEGIPFAHIFGSLVYWSEKEMIRITKRFSLERLEALARQNLRSNLFESLLSLCGPSLLAEFAGFKVSTKLYQNDFGAHSNDDTYFYRQFVEHFQRQGSSDYLMTFPVIARLITEIVSNWIANSSNFVCRLVADTGAISSLFGIENKKLYCVHSIVTNLSDSHNGGQKTWKVNFSSGAILLYKPKSIASEVAWCELLGWLRQVGSPESATIFNVLDRTTYGWVEFVENAPCLLPTCISTYYRRAGATLFMLYLLGANDIHYENVISAGNAPAVIDLETLLQPTINDIDQKSGENRAREIARGRLRHSVLSTGFLPTLLFGVRPNPIQIGGLGVRPARTRKMWTWRNANRNTMNMTVSRSMSQSGSNLPMLNGLEYGPDGFCDEICKGYEDMFRFVRDTEGVIPEILSRIEGLQFMPVRVVLRPTEAYDRLLSRIYNTQSLTDGGLWSIGLDFQSPLREYYRNDVIFQIQKAETQYLARLDIPLFLASAGSRELILPKGYRIKKFFKECGIDSAVYRIAELSDTRLDEEIEIIRCSVESIYSGDKVSAWPDLPRQESPDLSEYEAANVALCEATKIGKLLMRNAVRSGDSVAWIGVTPMPRNHAAHLDVVGYDYYSGTAGIALFLSALSVATNSPDCRNWSLMTISECRSELAKNSGREKLLRKMGYGGASGIASLAYCFCFIGKMLHEPCLVEEATALIRIMRDRMNDSKLELDVVSGAAGVILAALSIYDLSKDHDMLQVAKRFGSVLVERQIKESGGWTTIAAKPLCGFSHGCAGISYALLRLSDACGDSIYWQTAELALRFERRHFSNELQNWPDFRTKSEISEGSPNAWCHGGVGIGLARLACQTYIDTPETADEIDVVTAKTIAETLSGADHLCCGNFGKIDFLLSVAARTADRKLLNFAQNKAICLCGRSHLNGTFTWPIGTDRYNPGFFTGLSGVGYELLRASDPESFPSVISWV